MKTRLVSEQVAAFCDQERWDEAIALAERAGDDYEVLWSKGWALYKLGRFSEAIRALDAAVASAPESEQAVAHGARGVVFNALGDTRNAELDLRRSLELRDGYLARQALAVVLLREGRGEEAEAVLREGVQRKPGSRKRLEALADILSDLGREDEAEPWRTRAKHLPDGT